MAGTETIYVLFSCAILFCSLTLWVTKFVNFFQIKKIILLKTLPQECNIEMAFQNTFWFCSKFCSKLFSGSEITKVLKKVFKSKMYADFNYQGIFEKFSKLLCLCLLFCTIHILRGTNYFILFKFKNSV